MRNYTIEYDCCHVYTRLAHVHELTINYKNQKAKEKMVTFSETAHFSDVIAPACELMRKICCDSCQQKTSSLAMVSK